MKKDFNNLSLQEQELCRETAKVKWPEIENFFANGTLVTVDTSLDLLQVAVAIRNDDTNQIKQWMKNNRVTNTTDTQASRWQESDEMLWAVVVKPLVLVQEL